MSIAESTSSIEKIKTVIHAENQFSIKAYLIELWQYRELFYLLAWRDLLVRYKQTLIGFAWAILRPLITVAIFTVIFGQVAQLPSGNIPYVLFVFAGMLPWQFFSNALTETGNSLVGNSNIVSKIYFPRMLVPLASLAVCLFDAFIVSVLFILIMAWYHMWPSWQIVFIPIFIFWSCLFTFALGIWVAALNITYRDFRFIIPFVVQLGLYVCPVGFSSSLIPEKWLWVFYLNPLAAIIDGFRWCLFGASQPLHIEPMISSVLVTALFVVFSMRYFLESEKTIVDRI